PGGMRGVGWGGAAGPGGARAGWGGRRRAHGGNSWRYRHRVPLFADARHQLTPNRPRPPPHGATPPDTSSHRTGPARHRRTRNRPAHRRGRGGGRWGQARRGSDAMWVGGVTAWVLRPGAPLMQSSWITLTGRGRGADMHRRPRCLPSVQAWDWMFMPVA